MYLSETITDEDEILPSEVEMQTSGFLAVDHTLEGGVAGANIKFAFQFKINVAQTPVRFSAFCICFLINVILLCKEQQTTFTQQLHMWFDNFLDAAARDPTFNTSPSFQVLLLCVQSICS